MSVIAIKPYVGEEKDRLENFHGAQILFVGWEDHLIFCAPFCFALPPDTKFGDVVGGVLPGAFSYHPDWAKIDWAKAEWFKSGQPWKPVFERTLAENGLHHKDVLRFRTPGLTGIAGTCS